MSSRDWRRVLRRLFVLATMVSSFTSSLTTAQEPPPEATKWKAAQFPTFRLGDVAIAKVVQGEKGPQISLRFNGFDEAFVPRNRAIVKMVAEQQIRTVVKDGQEVEQAVTVMVPVRELVQQVQSIPTPQEARRADFPLSEVRIWNIRGEILSDEQIRASLATARHVFVVPPKKEHPFTVDPYYAAVLAPGVLFVEAKVPAPPARASGNPVEQQAARGPFRFVPARPAIPAQKLVPATPKAKPADKE